MARVRIICGIGIVAAVLAVGYGAPRLLRRVKFFQVRQIELVGVRYLSPDAVITALRLRPDASVFDATSPLAARVRELRGVADARVVRRLPAALQVIVREVEPVALVARSGPGMLVVDATGRALPYDPARSTLDLPVVSSADSAIAALLELIRSVEPGLYQDVTAARRLGRSDVELDLGAPARRVLFARDAGADVIRMVVMVREDLAARGRSYAELDARFASQVVVRRAVSRRPAGG